VQLTPLALREARRFIAEHHRHNEPPRGWLFGTALEVNGHRVGVGVASRPVARALQDGRTIEIVRLCLVEGAPHNAASRLYGALCRAAAALGYTSAVTYTLAEETGASLRAAGFEAEAQLEERETWSPDERWWRKQRDLFGNELRPAGAKTRWRRAL
jgi:hypothetical protein